MVQAYTVRIRRLDFGEIVLTVSFKLVIMKTLSQMIPFFSEHMDIALATYPYISRSGG